MNENIDVVRLWASRASFGLACVALTAMVHGGCQRQDEGATGTRTRSEPAALKVAPRESQPGILTPRDPEAPVAELPAPPPPEAKPAAKAPEAKAPTAEELEGTLTVKRLTVTTEVKDREPTEASTFVAGEGPITAFVELANAAEVDQKIVITFENGAKQRVGFIELSVPKNQKRWRTWGQTRQIKTGGEWTAVVSTESGVELSRQSFEVELPTLPSG